MNKEKKFYPVEGRFRGYLPVVIDVETGGFDHQKDALLEVAAVFIRLNEEKKLYCHRTQTWHIKPFEGGNLNPKSLEVNGIDPTHPLRLQIAVDERKCLLDLFHSTRHEMKMNHCTRAILVGHNAAFDLNFLNAAVTRIKHKRNPFHPFSTLDTVTLSAAAYGQTVLARAIRAARIDWDNSQAHSARYDAEKTAELFCKVVNQWKFPSE